MKKAFAILIGFLAIFLTYTFVDPTSFYALIAFYALALTLLFFLEGSFGAWYFLGGLTVGQELLGSARFGLATALFVFMALIYLFFGEQLRFTSPFIRYAFALFITLPLLLATLFPLSGLLYYSERAALMYPLLLLAGYFFSATQQPHITHELL